MVMPDPNAAGSSSRPRRVWGPAVAFGLATGLRVGFGLVGVIGRPLLLSAKGTEPGIGLQRPFVRNGLRAAPLTGLAAFALTTALATRWRLRHPPAC